MKNLWVNYSADDQVLAIAILDASLAPKSAGTALRLLVGHEDWDIYSSGDVRCCLDEAMSIQELADSLSARRAEYLKSEIVHQCECCLPVGA